MGKFHAWGANVIVRIQNPEVSKGGIIITGAKENAFECQGLVVSCGSLVKDGKQLIGKTVRFGGGMVQDEMGSKEDPYIFLTLNEVGIYSVALEEDEAVSLQLPT